jgi:ribosomal protein S18 acetylase RimI-like enzyme
MRYRCLPQKLGDIVKIRPYRDSDWKKLKEMYLESDEICMCVPSEYIDIWLRCLMDSFSIVAELDGKIVGHAVLSPVNDKEVSLCIYVRKGYRSKGIGTAMVKFLIEHCKTVGYEGIRIVTEKDNIRAINFFKKFGFRFVGAGYGYEMFLSLKSDET